MRACTAFLFLALFGSVAADEPVLKVNLREYLKTTGKESARKFWSDESRLLTAKLTAAKRGAIDRRLKAAGGSATDTVAGEIPEFRFAFPSSDEKRKMVASLEAQLKSAKASLASGEPLLPEMLPYKMAIGHVGRLRCPVPIGAPDGSWSQMRIVEVIDESSVRVEMGQHRDFRADFVLRIPSGGLVDGQSMDAGDKCYEVVRTTKVGGNTLFEVQPLNITSFLTGK